jgi:predicted transcriptional regulator
MYNADKPLLLGDFELKTLEYLWEHGCSTAKSMHSAIGILRGNSLNTVQSTLDRLYRKGLLERAKVGHSFQYRCLYNRTEVLSRKFGDLAKALSGGEMKPVFAAFIEFTKRLDESKLAELETLIADYRKNRGTGQ